MKIEELFNFINRNQDSKMVVLYATKICGHQVKEYGKKFLIPGTFQVHKKGTSRYDYYISIGTGILMLADIKNVAVVFE